MSYHSLIDCLVITCGLHKPPPSKDEWRAALELYYMQPYENPVYPLEKVLEQLDELKNSGLVYYDNFELGNAEIFVYFSRNRN